MTERMSAMSKTKKQIFLSKSKFMDGLICPKLLWYDYHKKEVIPAPNAFDQDIMDQGTKVGELARDLFSGGITVKRDKDPLVTAANSLKVIDKKAPLFESGFVFGRFYALPDILVPAGSKEWDLIEVKSTGEVKDEHIYDVAYQKYVYEGAGLKIRKCYLLHLNKDYVKQGPLDPKKLFIKEDITSRVDNIGLDIGKAANDMLNIIGSKEPDIKAGRQCDGKCPLNALCWSFLPEGSIFELRGRKDTSFELMNIGIMRIKDIPDSFELNDKHLIQRSTHLSGKPYINEKAIKGFLDGLEYPLYFLDFETISTAIPIYDLSRPYENIPFQYSLHIVRKEGQKPEHHSFIADGASDPRPEILKQLKDLLEKSGSVIAYNAVYEKNCLEDAVSFYQEYADWFSGIKKRIVDLLVPFRTLNYYHTDQMGSASLKKVLPALTGKSYAGLEIADGGSARLEYMKVISDKTTGPKEKKRIFKGLEEYCGQDTMGMVDIVNTLRTLI